MAFSGMINVKTGQLTLGGQFEAYKRGQLERNIQHGWETILIALSCFCFQAIHTILTFKINFSIDSFAERTTSTLH